MTPVGRVASVTSPGTWSSWAAADASSCGVGVGFVLDGSDGIVCIDLDHCLTDGHLAPWAAAVLEAVPPTYIEVSPSGDGLHVWGTGPVGRGRRIRDHRSIEVYSQGRYIAVTSQRWEGAPSLLADLTAVLAAV